MKTIVKMIAGSHLYGTNTESSDTDYKGIYLPKIEDCILGRVRKTLNESTGDSGSKNTKDDVDDEMYSIQHFIKLATAGETVAIDMLHTPDNLLTEWTSIWTDIKNNRSKFYSKNMKAFVGYARSQAKRYSVKGDRLKLAEDCLEIISCKKESTRLGDSFFALANIKGTSFSKDNFSKMFIDINGRKFGEDVTIKYAKDKIQMIIDDYGHRAQKAKEAGGIDWKAISHAMRVVLEVKEILTTGDLHFPLAQAEYLKRIKRGGFDKVGLEFILAFLDEAIEQVEELISKSDLPDTVDTEYWDNFIVGLYK